MEIEKMSENLPAINIEELTDNVNAVVNMKHMEPNIKHLRPIAPRTTSSCYTADNASTIIVSTNNTTDMTSTSSSLPLMVSVQLPTSTGATSSTSVPLSVILDGGMNNSQPLVDLNNIHHANLPPFTTQTFSADLPSQSTSQLLDTYNQSTSHDRQSSIYQINSNTTSSHTVLPNLIFSPSDANAASRFFMTSPLPILSVSEKETPISTSSNYSPRPLSVIPNINGLSMIEALLKPQDNGQFLAPIQIEKPVSVVKPVSDPSKRIPALPAYYCVECAHTHYTPCKHHACDYSNITDKPVLSRARQTLPSCLHLQFSKITGHFNDSGVVANINISMMTQFGPLLGKPINDSTEKDVHIFKHWKIFYKLDDQIQCDILDVSDENYSNWLMFIKPARSSAEQNLVAYQSNDSIMFITCKNVEPGSELLFWYSKEYAKQIGFMTKPNRINYCPYCYQCDQIFPDKKSLLEHKKRHHSDKTIRKHQCQYCEKRFTSSGKLNTHIVACHMQLKPYSCNQCGKEFSDQSNLRIHQAIHTGVKKFICSMCSKSFRQKAHLTSHMLTHTKIKSVDCPQCVKKFARVSDMKSHLLSHTQERALQCAQCNKVFYKPQNYKKHMKIHNNERNYCCLSCLKKFYSNYHLQRHLKSCKRNKFDKLVNELQTEEMYKNRSHELENIVINPLTSTDSTVMVINPHVNNITSVSLPTCISNTLPSIDTCLVNNAMPACSTAQGNNSLPICSTVLVNNSLTSCSSRNVNTVVQCPDTSDEMFATIHLSDTS